MIEDLLEKIKGTHVLVIGDVMLDKNVYAVSERICPEAPVPAVRIVRSKPPTYFPGGASNVAANLAALGVNVHLIGAFGQDEHGEILQRLVTERGIRLRKEFLCQNNTPTIVKQRIFTSKGTQALRMDFEEYAHDFHLDSKTLEEVLRRDMQNFGAVIVSDYDKGVVTDEVLDIVNRCRQGMPTKVLLDPKPTHTLNIAGKVDLMTPNRREAGLMAGFDADESPFAEGEAERVCSAIRSKHGALDLVITMSEEGYLVAPKDDEMQKFPACPRESLADVTGAGDTFIANLAAGLAAGGTLLQSAELANLAAGVVVGKVGTAVANPQEILSHAAAGSVQISL